MKLETQVCSLALAKRLKELGVKQGNSYFCWSYWVDHSPAEQVECHEAHWEVTDKDNGNPGGVDAFTVAELGEMFPICSFRSEAYSSKGKRTWIIAELVTVTQHAVFDDTEANARAKILIYLLEKGLVKL